MKFFLALYTCAENSKNHNKWKELTQQAKKEILQNGSAIAELWAAKHKHQIVFDGSPLGNSTKIVDIDGIQDVPSKMGHFMIIQAVSHEEAAKMFLDHPHFSIFPGDGIEILECLSYPRS